ncbi:MAG: hypothetical protein ACPGJV_09005 [Bacteriovoracaceae bacterium]
MKSLKTTLLIAIALIFQACGEGALMYVNTNPEPSFVKQSFQLKDFDVGVCGGFAVDIIWIIDNSGSMSEAQQNVIDNTKLFINEFSATAQVDWRMTLLSSDTSEETSNPNGPGRIPNPNPYLPMKSPYFTQNDLTPIETFQNAVKTLGTSGSGTEVMMDSILKYLNKYPKFIRSNACLVMIKVTDAADQSSKHNVSSFIQRILQFKTDIEKVKFYSVIAANDLVPACKPGPGEGTWTYQGSASQQLVNATKGEQFSLCDPNFGELLSEIGKKIVELLQNSKLPLTERPRPETIRVAYEGKLLPGGPKEKGGYWYYDPVYNTIVFYDLNFAPGEKEKVRIEFEVDDGVVRD